MKFSKFTHKKMCFRAQKSAQFANHLPCKELGSSILAFKKKKNGHNVCLSILGADKTQEDPWGLLANRSSPIIELQI